MLEEVQKIGGGWQSLFSGDDTTGQIAVNNISQYKLINIIGYIGTNTGGNRFSLVVSTKQAFGLDYSFYLKANTYGQVNLTNNLITVTAADDHIVAVYGLK